jgi:hypothetical protein
MLLTCWIWPRRSWRERLLRRVHGATRAAAILARSALEDLVTDACAREGVGVVRTSIRVRLACLRALVPSIAGDAAVAWSGLSRACHQHAYEIAPHHAEVSHLVWNVRQLVE